MAVHVKITEANKKKLQAFQMDFLRRCCWISRSDLVRNDRIKEIMDLDKTITDRVDEKQLVRSPTKDVRREVAKEDLGMDPTWKKEKRTTTKDLVQ
jgi:hypothetical protein